MIEQMSELPRGKLSQPSLALSFEVHLTKKYTSGTLFYKAICLFLSMHERVDPVHTVSSSRIQ